MAKTPDPKGSATDPNSAAVDSWRHPIEPRPEEPKAAPKEQPAPSDPRTKAS